jgi:hypothetical protein
MSPEKRQEWFRQCGEDAYLKREFGNSENRYINAKFRCAGNTVRERRWDKKNLPQWYKSGSFSGNEWGI